MRIEPQPIWLIVNEKSGSFSEDAVQALAEAFDAARFPVRRLVRIPTDDAPTPAQLDEAEIGLAAIFTGDGTISSVVAGLGGWGGKVLVLPGGTMNLLSGRLHGEVDECEIVARLAGEVTARDMPIICHGERQALVGISAGPGAMWYDVREDMRDLSIGQLVGDAADAASATVAGPFVHCVEPALGRDTGYPLIELEPSEEGIRIVAFTAETLGGYLEQGWAMLKREFREGPHKVLGHADSVTLRADEDIALSVDGEPQEGSREETFVVARSGVDLVATRA
ncbi:diacylglycerol kinase family protein [Alteriqipengyuania sp. WL0013]|uniref:diacylglycerol kinase family protein n=1 Tax=Alteriqipengyuania sp. WL0013 TaxID=3110773 RepID=UPI002BD2D103|nr:diacylglycerol kinase family protein [Alteriqipengyuania sp. WL0013]MEB3416359.1 diacylglycerol kinase family protein [Alteriqipengyuania sp. WL0013]